MFIPSLSLRANNGLEAGGGRGSALPFPFPSKRRPESSEEKRPDSWEFEVADDVEWSL